MSDLKVIDVSAMIHYGCESVHYRDRTFYGYPVGGIHYLMQEIVASLIKRDHIAVCFDSPSFRVELYPKYKNGRVKNAAVISQIETVYEALSACGIQCFKFDGYEADDIIDWFCQEYVGKYESIDIVGNDIDLCHSVQSGIRFKSIVSGTPMVYYANFSNTVVCGKFIRFNTISAYKTFVGCSSDKIPSMRLQNGTTGTALYDKFLEYVDATYPNANYKLLTDRRLPVAFVMSDFLPKGFFTPEEQQEIYRRTLLVYPADRPADVTLEPTTISQVNKEKLTEFLAMYGDKVSLKGWTTRRPNLVDSQKEILREKARRLCTGEFAADHGVEPVSKVNTSTLRLDAFTREF